MAKTRKIQSIKSKRIPTKRPKLNKFLERTDRRIQPRLQPKNRSIAKETNGKRKEIFGLNETFEKSNRDMDAFDDDFEDVLRSFPSAFDSKMF